MKSSANVVTTDTLRAVAPGGGVVIARQGFTVLIDDPSLSRAHEVWRAIGSEHSVDAVIDVLAKDGLRSMPGAVIAFREGLQLRIIVRGSVLADVAVGGDGSASDEADSRVLDGTTIRSWTETTIDDWLTCRMYLAGSVTSDSPAAAQGDFETFLSSGIAQAGAVVWDRVADADDATENVAAPTSGNTVPSPNVEPVVHESSLTDTPTENTAQTEPDDPRGHDAAAVAVADGPDGEESSVPVVAAAPVVEAPVVDAPAGETEVSADPVVDAVPTGDGAPSVPTASPARADDGANGDDANNDDVGDDPYAEMFGSTVHRNVQAAAVEATTESDGEVVPGDDSVVDGDVAEGSGEEPEDPNGESLPANETRSLADFSDARPSPAAPPPIQPPTPAATNQPGDHDGYTMSVTELRRRRSETPTEQVTVAPLAPPPNSSAAGPTVQAVLCSAGHPNPVYASQCRQCNQPVVGDIVVVARPTLGRLRASSGEIVELDRPVIVGRNPSLAGRRVSEIPQEWRIAAAEGLSRSHAMFHIDGWQVRVEDLGSVNSTTVTLPGREPERLRVGEPVLVTDGTLIDLGGEVTCTYDATA